MHYLGLKLLESLEENAFQKCLVILLSVKTIVIQQVLCRWCECHRGWLMLYQCPQPYTCHYHLSHEQSYTAGVGAGNRPLNKSCQVKNFICAHTC